MRRDGCRPVDRDVNRIFVGCCEKQAGGFKKPGAPVFTPKIRNPVNSCEVDQFWAEETGELIITDDEQFIILDNTCPAEDPDQFGVFPGCCEPNQQLPESDFYWADEDFVLVVTDDNQNVIIDNRF